MNKWMVVIALLIIFIAALLVVCITSMHQFHRQTQAITNAIQTAQTKTYALAITDQDIQHLPQPVQRWLHRSGVVGKLPIRTVSLTQTGTMKLKLQSSWIPIAAQQISTIEQPAFVWSLSMKMFGLPIVGRDSCMNGQGKMDIRLAGLIPVVSVSNNPKISQSALQRFLGEIVWFPSAALQPYITWKSIDDHSAEATITSGDTTGSGIFYFNNDYDIEKFVAYRYKDIQDEQPLPWIASIKQVSEISGYRIPTQLEATWMLPSGPFTWYKFSIPTYTVSYPPDRQ